MTSEEPLKRDIYLGEKMLELANIIQEALLMHQRRVEELEKRITAIELEIPRTS